MIESNKASAILLSCAELIGETMSTSKKPGAVASGANKKMMNPLKPMLAFLLLLIGYYVGLQHAVVMQGDSLDLHGTPHSFPVQKKIPSTLSSKSSKKFTDKKSAPLEDPGIFQLHPQIQLSEDPDLYRNIVNPLVEKLIKKGEVPSCSPEPLKPYFDILNNIEKNPMFYEDDHVKNTPQSCPVVFLFYFEGGTKLADNFFNFYGNISNKRCLNFIVNIRWRDSSETKEIVEKHGFTIVGESYPKQDKTISMSLDKIKEQYGEDVLVSVNDLDHLLVWFDREGKPHRYSSYTDMVKLYVYELLTTQGCSDQNVHEKYVIPCTCLMEKNEKYISTINDGIVWSEYGITNRFHPTANFYLNRTLETRAEKGKSAYAYSIGTVFANLRKYEVRKFCVDWWK